MAGEISAYETMTVHPGSDAGAIIDMAQNATEPDELDPEIVYGRVLPPGARHEVIDLEKHLPAPRRTKGVVNLVTDESLSRYVNEYGLDGEIALYASHESWRVTAVLNHHRGEHTAWGDHRAVLHLKATTAWERWAALNGRLGPQTTFAQLIEDGIEDIVEPAGAEMLELAQSFQAHTRVEFKSQRRLDNGETQFTFVEEVDARAGQQGTIQIPKEFVLGIAPFEGCDPYKVVARLRYRLNGGDLQIGYQLVRPEDIQRAAFDDVVGRIESETELTAFRGSPLPVQP
jgi:uncharacterized protein YfdQ (DUF2303 family)